MRHALILSAALSLSLSLALAGSASAAAPGVALPKTTIPAGKATIKCRDAKGHFAKCPTTAPAASNKCRTAAGHFARCGAPGARPA